MPLNVLDWIIIIVLLFFLIKSIIRGAAREIFPLLALFFAGFYSCKYYVKIAPYLKSFLSQSWAQNIVAFVALFLSIYLLINLIGWLIYRFIKTIKLGFLDSTIGALIGTAKAYILACFLILFISLFPQGSNLLKGSIFAGYCYPFINLVSDLFPDELKKIIDEKTKEFKNKGVSLNNLKV